MVGGKRGDAGDEPGMAPHHLHHSDSVGRPLRLAMRSVQRLHRLRGRRHESEALVHPLEIVVDRLGHPDHPDGQLPAPDLIADLQRPPHGAVSPDHEQHVNPVTDQTVHHRLRGLRPARCSKDGSAALVDLGDEVRSEFHLQPFRDQPAVAVLKPHYPLHAVVIARAHHDVADHIVEAGAQTAAGHDADRGPPGIEEQLAPRPGQFEGGRLFDGKTFLQQAVRPVVREHALGTVPEPDSRFPLLIEAFQQGGGGLPLPKGFHYTIVFRRHRSAAARRADHAVRRRRSQSHWSIARDSRPPRWRSFDKVCVQAHTEHPTLNSQCPRTRTGTRWDGRAARGSPMSGWIFLVGCWIFQIPSPRQLFEQGLATVRPAP